MNQQFISSNQFAIAKMISTYKELIDMYSHLTLYLDSTGWEIFDVRIGKPIFRHSFKHIKALTEDLQKFTHHYINLVDLYHRLPDKQVSGKRALNYFTKYYNEEELKYFYYG